MTTHDYKAGSSTLGCTGATVVKELSGGNSNVTCLVEQRPEDMVLRTPPGDTISPKAHRGVEREAVVMGALHGHVAVPEVLAWCGDSEIIGRPFALVEHIDGVSITDSLAPRVRRCRRGKQLGRAAD